MHAKRRVEDLAQPVIAAALDDAGVRPDMVDELIMGNISGDGNLARLIGLLCGFRETSTAYVIDRACTSGLDAVLAGIRSIALGQSDIVVAGGAESLSTAPWRVARPRSAFQTPRFYSVVDGFANNGGDRDQLEAMEAFIGSRSISRKDQDCYALETIDRARSAYDGRRFVGEIVPMQVEPGEAIDEQLNRGAALGSLDLLDALVEPGGTITSGNVASLSDGAAFTVIVSEEMFGKLGSERGLELVASATVGGPMGNPGAALVGALEVLADKTSDVFPGDVDVFEINEASAGEILLVKDLFTLDGARINPSGGAIARGHAPGASGALLLARLFSSLVRDESMAMDMGVAALGGHGGQGIAALFKAVNSS